jgi:hypothetical protein
VTLPAGYASQPDTLMVSGVSEPILNEDGSSNWEVVIIRQIFTSQNLSSARDQIVGKSSEQAAQILIDQLELTEQPEIEITPSWWPWLPWLKSRITIIDLREGE